MRIFAIKKHTINIIMSHMAGGIVRVYSSRGSYRETCYISDNNRKMLCLVRTLHYPGLHATLYYVYDTGEVKNTVVVFDAVFKFKRERSKELLRRMVNDEEIDKRELRETLEKETLYTVSFHATPIAILKTDEDGWLTEYIVYAFDRYLKIVHRKRGVSVMIHRDYFKQHDQLHLLTVSPLDTTIYEIENNAELIAEVI